MLFPMLILYIFLVIWCSAVISLIVDSGLKGLRFVELIEDRRAVGKEVDV